jgi:hypothetical protein
MNRRTLWLWVALLLFGFGAWLMSIGETGTAADVKHKEREFPHIALETFQREEKRMTMPPAPPRAEGERPRKRDPVLTALAPKAEVNLVLEASAIRDTPVGELLLRCLSRSPGNGQLEQWKRQGLDWVRDLDRLALSDEVVILSGNFGNARWDDVLERRPSAVKDGTTLY